MREVWEGNGRRLLEYTPTAAQPLYVDFEPMRLVRRLRFLLEYLGKNHYRVYYLEAEGKLVGHCVVSPGGRRLKCSGPEDIVLGPYYVVPEERGKGYGKQLIRLVLENAEYRCAWDWVEKSNTASCRATEACGFQKAGELNVTGLLRRLVIVENGDDNIYKYTGTREGA